MVSSTVPRRSNCAIIYRSQSNPFYQYIIRHRSETFYNLRETAPETRFNSLQLDRSGEFSEDENGTEVSFFPMLCSRMIKVFIRDIITES